VYQKPALPVLLCAAVATACPAWAACDTTTAKNIVKTTVRLLPNRVFVHFSKLELDFDGSPVAYGLRDQGQEGICNGLAPASGSCKGQFQSACFSVCQQTFASWSRTSGKVEDIPKTMCSFGLGGSNCSRPNVHLQSAPHADFFVSETSLKVSPNSGPIEHEWTALQAAQLDPATIPYLVAPGAISRVGVKMGDVGIAYNAANNVEVPFIVGDGGSLGEGSVSLLAALKPDAPPKLTPVTSALGEKVMRYRSGIEGEFHLVIFPSTASLTPGSHSPITSMGADALAHWINDAAHDALQKRSNRAEVFACSR